MSKRFFRRTGFAAPFVVTALLAPGCGGGQHPPKPDQPTPDAATPRSVDDAATAAATTGWVELAGGAGWAFFGDDPMSAIYLQADGTCEQEVPSSPCPAGARCNPPPPRTVDCPPGLPADAVKPAP